MVYVPDRESLAETLARAMATGLSISEAQRDICRALNDGKFRTRYRIGKVETPLGAEVSRRLVGQPRFGADREIVGRPLNPADLGPDDIDWANSRPKNPWRDVRGFLVQIEKIEVSTQDVIRVLCREESGDSLRHALRKASPEKKTNDKPVAATAKKTATIAVKTRAIKALREMLKINRDLRTKEAKGYCESIGISLGDGPFRRAWQTARVQEEMTPTARPGRPRKSSR
jgi:hypothetical protein